MRLIDADALIAQMEAEAEYIKEPIMAMFVYAAINDVKHAPTIEPEPHWHECIEGDPASFPNDDRNVLVSFSNFSLSIIGQWRTDEDAGGAAGIWAIQMRHLSKMTYMLMDGGGCRRNP